MKEDCIFCKLANGVFPTNSVYEDDMFNVIMDINPISKGHCLVLCKEHYDNALVAPEEILGKAFILASKIANAVKKTVGCDGINILQEHFCRKVTLSSVIFTSILVISLAVLYISILRFGTRKRF